VERLIGAGDLCRPSRRRLEMIAVVENSLREVDLLRCARFGLIELR